MIRLNLWFDLSGNNIHEPQFMYNRWIFAVIVTYTVYTSYSEHIKQYTFALYFIYFTRWGITLNMIVGIYGAILVTMWHCSSNFQENVVKTERMPGKFKVYWALKNITQSIALVITIIYWKFIYVETDALDQLNIFSHIVNSIITLIDLCVVAHPIRLFHFIQPVCFGALYGLFTYIYHICGGVNDKGDPFIYKFILWKEPLKTVGTICSTLILCAVVHVILYFIYALRVCIQNRCCFNKSILATTSSKSNAAVVPSMYPKHITTSPI